MEATGNRQLAGANPIFLRLLTAALPLRTRGTARPANTKRTTGDHSTVDYWLDIGNNADSGQFILGEPLNQVNRRARARLRTAAEWFPEIVDASFDNDGMPSCSAAEALERQEPFVNQALSQHALALLARLFRYGMTSYYGGFINLTTGACTPLSAEPRFWRQAALRRRREAKHREASTPCAA